MARRTTATSKVAPKGDRASYLVAQGYRSGLEERVAAELAKTLQAPPAYEQHKVHYTPPMKLRSYLPDFVLPNGVIVETKGRFLTADRQKHKIIKLEHPGLDIRFVFSRSRTTLSKASKTTYADWCIQYGFQWADVSVPQPWIEEPTCPQRWAAIERASKK